MSFETEYQNWLGQENLEPSLKEQLEKMTDVEKRVVGDFGLFTKEQSKNYADFQNDMRIKSDELTIKMQSLEGELNELKERAYDNVSDKLNVFEQIIDNGTVYK